MRMTASWFGSLDLPHTRLWCDSIAPKSGLPSDCHPAARSNRETDDGKNASPCLTQKAPYKGLSADSGEKHEPAGDPDVVAVDSLKALDPNRPIREADMGLAWRVAQTIKPRPAARPLFRPLSEVKRTSRRHGKMTLMTHFDISL